LSVEAGTGELPNDYSVKMRHSELGWEVQISDPEGAVLWTRACSDETEARTLASTVRQHIYWLSPVKFREYYKLAGPD
jgi:hypothetical protein